MAQNRNPLSQLASFGEDVLEKASKNPAASRVLQSANQLRDRVDELSRRVRGLDVLEQRVAKLEKPPRRAAAKPKTEATET